MLLIKVKSELRHKHVYEVLGIFLLILLCGCASYTNRLAKAKNHYICGNYAESLKNIDPGDCESGVDQLIFLLERANIKQCMGDFQGSNDDYEKAYSLIKDYESRPDYNIRAGLSEGSALFTNETVIPYKGEGYEKIMLHVCKAINFIMLGDLDGARVEIRRLDERLKKEKKRHEDTIAAADQKAREKNINNYQVSEINQRVLNSMGSTANLSSKVKSLYLSAFGSYLSSILYDMDGDYNDARIDAVRVVEIVPNFEYAARDAVVLGSENVRTPLGKSGIDLRNRGEMVLFYQCGLAPVKQEVKIAIPVLNVGVIATAFAVYQTIPTELHQAIIYIDGKEAGHTGILTDVEAQAIRTLVDNLPYTIVRAALRAATKGVTTYVVKEQFGIWGTLAASIYNVASESADLRSWLTLPKNIQGLKIYPHEGKHKIKIALVDYRDNIIWQSKPRNIEFKNNRTVFINLRAIGRTPILPNTVNVTDHWVTLPRVPLSGRPNYLMPYGGGDRRTPQNSNRVVDDIDSESFSETEEAGLQVGPRDVADATTIGEESYESPEPVKSSTVMTDDSEIGWLTGLPADTESQRESSPQGEDGQSDSTWLGGLAPAPLALEDASDAETGNDSSSNWLSGLSEGSGARQESGFVEIGEEPESGGLYGVTYDSGIQDVEPLPEVKSPDWL